MPVTRLLNAKNKALVILIFSYIFLGIFHVSTLAAVALCRKWYGLLVGGALMLAAIPFHLRGRKHPHGYLISYFLNAVAAGFSVSAYYLKKNIAVCLPDMLVAAVPAAVILLSAYLLLRCFCKRKKTAIAAALVLNLLLLISRVLSWRTDNGFGFFCALISLFSLWVYAVTVNRDRSVLRDISFGSFGTFILLTLAVLIILTEGDTLDGLDIDFGTGGKRKKKK